MLRPISSCCSRKSLVSRSFSTSLARLQASTGGSSDSGSGPTSSQIPNDMLSNFAKNTVSKQDTDTFISVFNKIMSYKNDAKAKDKGTLQLIFEKNLNNKTQNINLTTDQTKDIRNLPLSVSGNMISSNLDQQKSLIEQIQRKHELKEAIAPTLQHLQSITNDYELIQYVESLLSQFTKLLNSEEFKNESLNDELLENIKETCSKTPESPLVNQFTIPFFLSSTIQLLSTKFNATVEAISIFQHVKNLDIKTYTFCCTTDVYNEILERTWQNFKDPYMIDSLVNEMKANGIVGDMDTVSILGLVINEMEHLLFGDGSEALLEASELEEDGDIIGDERKAVDFYNREDEKLIKEIRGFRTDLMATM